MQLQKQLYWQQNPCSYKLGQGSAPAAGRNIHMTIVPIACRRHTKLIVWHLRLHPTHCLALFLLHPSSQIPPNLTLSPCRSSARLNWTHSFLHSGLSLFSLLNNFKINPQFAWNVSAPLRTHGCLTGWFKCLACLMSGFASYFCPDHKDLISYTSIISSRTFKIFLNLFLQAESPTWFSIVK